MILLQFSGTQDIEAFGKVCEAMNEMDESWSGGSHEHRLGVLNGNIVIAHCDDFKERANDER